MVYLFGDCRLDDAARRLTRNGQDQRLSKKAYTLLVCLLGARPRVVTKREVMHAVWPSTFVSEANIAVLVSEVRAAVGDSARESKVVRTHSGVGYSFVADATEITGSTAAAMNGLVPVLTTGGRRIVLADGVSTLGRDQTCHVRLAHPSVSRLHARIVVDGTTASIEDAGSKNGVLVNGRRVDGTIRLPSGAALTVGVVELSFTFEETTAVSTWSIA